MSDKKDIKGRTVKYSVDFYLKDCERPEKVKRMMKDLFKGRSKTLSEWKEADDNVNGRRC